MSAQPTSPTGIRPNADLYLASRSPRRRQLLEQLGLRPLVVIGDVDETPRLGEAPAAYVARVAAAKAHAAWAALPAAPALPLLAADTTVVAGGRPLGKPVDSEAALSMLALLSERTHEVLTAVTLLGASGDGTARPCERHVISRTEVRMRAISADEALAYWETGEPRGKAGAYAIQGLGAVFVESLSGSYSNVVGLPLYETAELLREQGIAILGA